MSDHDSDSEVHCSSNGESEFEGFSAADIWKAAIAARANDAPSPSTSMAVPMDTDDSSQSDADHLPCNKSDTSMDEIRLYVI